MKLPSNDVDCISIIQRTGGVYKRNIECCTLTTRKFAQDCNSPGGWNNYEYVFILFIIISWQQNQHEAWWNHGNTVLPLQINWSTLPHEIKNNVNKESVKHVSDSNWTSGIDYDRVVYAEGNDQLAWLNSNTFLRKYW